MDKAEFESRFLQLINKSDVVITAANVAYHLGIGIEETQEHLLSLELNGTLEQKTDQQGNNYYHMPNRPTPGTPRALTDGTGGPTGGSPAQLAPGVHNPAELPHAQIYSTPTSGPAQGRSINGLVLNCIVPGVGSLVAGSAVGIVILLMFLGGFAMFFLLPGFLKFLGLPTILASWIWSIIAGVMLLKRQEPGVGVPKGKGRGRRGGGG